VEKYAAQGRILDLGCGSGDTAVELALDSYRDYTGVDISDVAIAKAVLRSQEAGRAQKNHFDQSDFSNYTLAGQYNVILFRDSIYYVPLRKIKTMLEGYSAHLTANGVFIVRSFGRGNDNDRQIVKIFEDNFKVVDQYLHRDHQALIVIFRPDSKAENRVGPGVQRSA
jgi:SAM-dependent methyltransferase